MVGVSILEYFKPIFYPKSIAIIGASNNEAKYGFFATKYLKDFGYEGRIYPVTRSSEEVYGLKAYKSVMDIPDEVDYAIVVVAAKSVPQVIKECAAKGIKFVNVWSGGFSETGPEGKKLEDEVRDAVRTTGIRLIGPNCMGVHCTSNRMTMVPGALPEVGGVSFISQSGGFSTDVIRMGQALGLRFSKVVSVGNSVDLSANDFLAYFAADPETRIIMAYIERLKDGKEFVRLAKEVSQEKPIILLKGGQTEAGRKAVSSHTGTLAGNYRVWQGVFKQTGIIPVDSLEEMLETALGFSFLQLPQGRRIALIGSGGGATVTATDLCSRYNLTLANFNPETKEKLKSTGIPAWAILNNPIDTASGALAVDEGRVLTNLIRTVSSDPGVDIILVHLNVQNMIAFTHVSKARTYFQNMVTGIIRATKESRVPVAAVLRRNGELEIERICYEEQQRCLAEGVPVYPTIASGVRALSHLAAYREYKEKLERDTSIK